MTPLFKDFSHVDALPTLHSFDAWPLKIGGDQAVMKAATSLLFAIIVLAPTALSQTAPERGSNELQVWTGRGHGLNGTTSTTAFCNLGSLYGWMLPNPHRHRFSP